ncbi:MAG: histidine kinase [Bacillota bacterium]
MESVITDLEKRINDIKKRLPAHSVKPSMVEELEELEEQLAILKEKLDGGNRDET